MTNESFALAIIGLAIQTIAIVVTGMWRLSRARDEIISRMDEKVSDIEAKFDEFRDDVHARLEVTHKEYRETFSALREKITQVEIWSRDTFVRRESFFQVIDGLKEQIKALGEKMDVQYDRFMKQFGLR